MLSTSFLEFIAKENLFKRSEHLLLAISGGLDSVVLAYLLKQNNFQFSVAHMNFQLRGKDSDRDEVYVKELAKQLEVECYVKRVEIIKGSESTQMQARALRYEWFEELMLENSIDKLLTAHHANDLLETALLNLTRGTGIRGLRSILPKQNRRVRPLLFAKKEELREFATENSIAWREDSSNSSDDYFRNKLRHQVIPPLLEMNPNLLSGFHQTTLRLRATEEAWQEKLNSIAAKYFRFEEKQIEIDKAILEEENALIYLSELLSDVGFSLSQLQSFDFGRVGAQLLSITHILSVDRDFLIIRRENKENKDKLNVNFFPLRLITNENIIHTPYGSLKLEYIQREEVNFERKQNLAFIDVEKIDEPLEIDLWQEGDKIQPIGMKGKKKISDILIDQKVPLPDKEKVMLLKSGREVIWVLGYKFSELFKLTRDSKKILRIEYSEY